MWLFHYPPFLFSSFPMLFLPLLLNLHLILLMHPFYPCSSFMEDDMGLLGLPHFCLFSGLWVCLLALPIGLAHWALFPSFFLFVLLLPFASILPHFFLFLGLWDYLLHFLPGFYNPLCFCHCLLITFLHFSLLVIGPFLSKMGINTHFALAPFKFKQLQTIFYRCVCVYH